MVECGPIRRAVVIPGGIKQSIVFFFLMLYMILKHSLAKLLNFHKSFSFKVTGQTKSVTVPQLTTKHAS